MTAILGILWLTAAFAADPQPQTKTPADQPAADKAPAAPTDGAKEESVKKAEAKPKPTLRLRRKGDEKEAEKTKTPAAKKAMVDDDKPPVDADRKIPVPEKATKKRSDLDRQLLDELAPDAKAAEEEESDPLLRAGRRMRTLEEKLAKLDGSGETVDLQAKVVADLDEMLKRSQQKSPKNDQKNQKQKKQMKGQKAEKQQQQTAQQQQQQKKSNESAEAAKRGQAGRVETGSPKEVKDVWGHLSSMMRDEMSQYAKDSFLPQYREMLERYYTTIATQSQNRSE